MKIRILSDLHLDINENYPFRLDDKDIFTIICGDISGSISKTCDWIDKNIHKGLFIAGNHMFYNENLPVEKIEDAYAKHYPLENSISFLNNDMKIIDDIVFVGCTLWTNYKLFGDSSADLYKFFATRSMNDYRYGSFEKDGKILRLTPEYCEEMFNKSVEYIHEIAQKYSQKKIVVITHHAPSVQSIEKEYLNSETPPAFASNLEDFILNHPNIKLWCHGHIHYFRDYYIDSCRVICNPRGYEHFSEETGFNPNFTVEL